MTFSEKIKEELSTLPIKNPKCALAECCGMILFANATTSERIKITTENKNVAHRASWLLKSLFGFDFDKKIVPALTTKKFNLIIESKEKLFEIFEAFGLDMKSSLSLRLNAAIVESDDERAAFCRGAFLTGGSVTDPKLRYHLELVTSHSILTREVVSLLLELELPAKITSRKSNNVVYLKESGHIEDFLTRIGAPLSTIELMQTKLVKDVRNQINRQVNCEYANLARVADAANAHIHAINVLQEAGKLTALPPQLQAAAKLRLDYPDDSLSALVLRTNGAVSKSGLNHRLNKLIELANEITSRKDSQ
ncbi:MAG: DNA-binding protein WhiA [Oscillospiraceae bacterium]|nr:DNA-binding protein WhiA [Oscillospiraceae bacterium]